MTVAAELPAFDVFVSYNSDDSGPAHDLAERLRDEIGIRAWLDRDTIRPGESWEESIQSAIANSKCCVVILGAHGLSFYHAREALIALARKRNDAAFPLFLVILEGANPKEIEMPSGIQPEDAAHLSAFISSRQWIDLSRNDLSEFLRLGSGIQGREITAEELPNISPYRLNKDALRWERSRGKAKRGVLYRGSDLAEAQGLAKRVPKRMSPSATGFLAASADREQFVSRAVNSALIAGIVVSAGLAGWFIHLRNIAEDQRKQAVIARKNEETQRRRAEQESVRAIRGESRAREGEAQARAAQAEAEERRREATATYLAELVQTKRLESPHFTALLPALAVEAGKRSRSAEIATALLDAIRIQPTSVTEFNHSHGVVAVRFDPTGQLLASGSSSGLVLGELNGAIKWRDQASQAGRRVCSVEALDYHPNGREIAAGCFDSRVDIFNSADGTVKRSLPQNSWVLAVRYSSDGAFLATSDNRSHVRIYETNAQHPPVDVIMPKECETVAFHPKNAWLATGCQDGKLSLIDISTGSIKDAFDIGQKVSSIDVSSDGTWLAAVSSVGKLWVYDFDQKTLESKDFSKEPLERVLIAPDGRHVLIAGWDGKCRILNREFVEIARVMHAGPVSDIAINSDSTLAASTGDDGIAFVFELNSGHIAQVLPHGDRVLAVAFAPGRHLVATGSLNNRAAIYNLPQDSVNWVREKIGTELTAARFIEGRSLILAWNRVRSQWQSFETLTGRPLGEAAQLLSSLHGIGADREGGVVSAFSGLGGVIFGKNGETIQPRTTASIDYSSRFDPLLGTFAATAVSPQGDAAAFGDSNGILVFELNSQTKPRQLRVSPSFRVAALEFSPNGKQLAAGFANGEVQVWDWKGERQTRSLLKTGLAFDQLRALAWTPDGKFVACGGEAKQVLIWNIETGQHVIRIPHAATIRALEFIEDGRRIRSLESTGTIRTFLWRQKDLMARACEVAPIKAMERDRWKTWIPGEPFSATCESNAPVQPSSK